MNDKNLKTSDLSHTLYWLERAACKSAQIKHVFLPEDGDVDKIHVTYYGEDIDPGCQRIVATILTELRNMDKAAAADRIKRAREAAPQLYHGVRSRAGLGTTIPGMCLRDRRFDPTNRQMVVFALSYFAEDMRVDYFQLKDLDGRVGISLPDGCAYDVGRRQELINAVLLFLAEVSEQVEPYWDQKDETKRVCAYVRGFNRFDRKKELFEIRRKVKKTDKKPKSEVKTTST